MSNKAHCVLGHMDQTEQTSVDITEITADVISSYVANNRVHRAGLPAVIASVHATLQTFVLP